MNEQPQRPAQMPFDEWWTEFLKIAASHQIPEGAFEKDVCRELYYDDDSWPCTPQEAFDEEMDEWRRGC